MPRTYSRRGYRRRRTNRTRRALSKRNVFMNRSARSQAMQIAALNRRITTLSRATRPEIKISQVSDNLGDFNLSSEALTSSYYYKVIALPSQGTGDAYRIGNKIFVKDLYIKIAAEYYNNSTTGYHDTESSGTPVRVVLMETKGPVAGTFTWTPDQLLEWSAASGADYSLRAVSPFRQGITTQFKILYDKVRTVSTDRNQYLQTIHVKNKVLTWTEAGLVDRWLLFIMPAGLHFDTDFKEYFRGHFMAKIAYTDM